MPMPSSSLKPLLASIAAWIMTLDVGSNEINSAIAKDSLNTSIFINGNLARVLLASHRITGDAAHLDVGLKWCDTLVSLQVPAKTHDGLATGGWWNTGYDDLFIADTGTAVTTLGLCANLATDTSRKAKYMEALTRWSTFVRGGVATTPKCTPILRKHKNCSFDGTPSKGEVTDSWVITSGAEAGGLGDGYYQQKINILPYTISTALTGGVFFAEYYFLGLQTLPRQELDAVKGIAQGAVKWLLGKVQPDGTIPYVIDPPTTVPHQYQCITYSAEAFVDAKLRWGGELVPAMVGGLNKTVEYLLKTQLPSGALMNGTSGEIQRSPRAISLLQLWDQMSASADPRVADAVSRYFAWLETPDGAAAATLRTTALATGFIGLAAADLIDEWSTFVR